MEGTIILIIVLAIYAYTFYHNYNVAKRHNLNKVVAIFSGFLWLGGLVLYSHLNYKLNKKKQKRQTD